MEIDDTYEEPTPSLDAIKRLGKDLMKAALTLSDAEARYLVDAYYSAQNKRMRSAAQVRQQAESVEPHAVLDWLVKQDATLEKEIRRALSAYTLGHRIGEWMRGVVGIGPVLAAGLLAHIDITKAPTVGHIWRYAGLDPSIKFLGSVKAGKIVADHPKDMPLDELVAVVCGQTGRKPERYRQWIDATEGKQTRATFTAWLSRMPWNDRLKVLCWKSGDSFMKQSGRADCYYGKVYAARKLLEIERNHAGMFAEQAAASLAEKNYGKETEAYKAYSAGRLPDARILLRAQRYAVKLFLAHLWEHWYRVHYGTAPPLPYPIIHIAGHSHHVPPPH